MARISRRISKINPFINKYKWTRINYPSEKDDLGKYEKNNLKIAHNMLYVKKTVYILPKF